MRSKIFPTLLVLALAAVVAAPAAAFDLGVSDTALGSGGVVFSVEAGEYASLVPDGAETRAENPVLVLRVRDASGQRQDFLVPASAGDEVEGGATLLFEESTGTAYLLWESWSPEASYSRIHLVGFADGAWQEITEVTGSPVVVRSSPRFAITRDEYVEPVAEGEPVVHRRSVLHLFWLEDARGAGQRVIYAPQFLVDGRRVGAAPPRSLNDLVPGAEGAASELGSAGGAEPRVPVLSLRGGQDAQTLLVTLSDLATRQLAVMELRVVPGEVSALAASVYDWLQAGPAGDREDWMEAADALVVRSFGSDLQEAGRAELGRQVADCLRTAPAGTPAAELAEPCSGEVLGVGTELDRSGIKSIFGNARPQWIGFGSRVDGESPVGRQHVSARLLSAHPVPAVMAHRPVDLLTSQDGGSVLVYWPDGEGDDAGLVYQEVGEDGWSAGSRLALGPGFDTGDAIRLLHRRVDGR